MKYIFWLEIKSLNKPLWFVVITISIAIYILLFISKYVGLPFLNYLPILLIVTVPLFIQSDRFRRIDKSKGLIDYFLVISSARAILLIRGLTGGLIGTIILLLSLPAIIIIGGWSYLLFAIAAVVWTTAYILVEGYSIWYRSDKFSSIFTVAIMFGVIIAINFPQLDFLVFTVLFISFVISGILSLFYAEKDKEKILS
ncbi:hypothetical protein HWHPT5561_03215 [Petrotoga sp. HWH.PT.55.6.1]|jgi:hypothetical protein|uniref:hypothetical protein n=1 Tax=unclassified Petrotoga TaxID=2620614 RepID=UPI000CA0007D|nr:MULTISPECIES: hypothetical protein [unclassified Petrotoga]PNR92967.1 hypothetical protein X926_05065 [Petrotoga sp. HWHPT.55.6.3]RPD36148.1 hypothetical protein HWHPT5561_03215 [Petrotoga sp. HWH.PT.55.6.1]